MRERATIALSPNIDHRFDGIPQAVVQQDPGRRAFIASLTKQVLEHPKKAALVKELFPQDAKITRKIVRKPKTVIQEQGNLEAFGLLELKDAIHV